MGLSKAPCWRRIQKLQDDRVIKQTVALLDARALNVGTTVFVTLKTGNHSEAWFERFVGAVRDIPEVTEIHRMSGDVDYLIRIVVPDIDAYDVVYKRLISAVEFQDVSASFALETIKHTTALPFATSSSSSGSSLLHGAACSSVLSRMISAMRAWISRVVELVGSWSLSTGLLGTLCASCCPPVRGRRRSRRSTGRCAADARAAPSGRARCAPARAARP